MEVFRICKQRNAGLTGTGAKITGGRWNSKGNAVIYCSENRSLAALEFLAHFTDYVIPDDLVLLSISLPTELKAEEMKLSKLPKNWRAFPAPQQLKRFGDDWVKKNSSLVLKVPSVLVENEFNYVINPAHDEIRKVKIVKKEKFGVDERFLKR